MSERIPADDDTRVDPTAPPPAPTVVLQTPPSGRLATVCGLGLLAGMIPLPLLPDRVLRQLRGAVAHDVLARHGISLVSDARLVLAQPNTADRIRTLLRKSVEMVSRRLLQRLGPLALLGTFVSAFELYALGHLLERYLQQVRPPGPARIYESEARQIRDTIDAAVAKMLSSETHPQPLVLPRGAEDLREEFTRWLDTIVLTSAALPSYLERRLEAAFDDVVAGARA